MKTPVTQLSDIAMVPCHGNKTCAVGKPKRRKRRPSYKNMLGNALKPASRQSDTTVGMLSLEPTGAFSKIDRI